MNKLLNENKLLDYYDSKFSSISKLWKYVIDYKSNLDLTKMNFHNYVSTFLSTNEVKVLDRSLGYVNEIYRLNAYDAIYTLKKDHNDPQIRSIIRTTKEVNGRIALLDVMKDLGSDEMNEVLIEAGSVLNGALLKENLIDEIVLYLAPCFLGDKAKGMFDLPILNVMAEKYDFKINDVNQIGPDIKVILRK